MTLSGQVLADRILAAGKDGPQAFAAAVQVLAVACDVAGQVDFPGPVGDAQRVIAQRFADLAEAEQVDNCIHIITRAPMVQLWAAWRPDLFGCADCTHERFSRPETGAALQRCEHCRRARPGIQLGAMLLPRLATDVGYGITLDTGPSVLAFSLCPPCRAGSTGRSPARRARRKNRGG